MGFLAVLNCAVVGALVLGVANPLSAGPTEDYALATFSALCLDRPFDPDALVALATSQIWKEMPPDRAVAALVSTNWQGDARAWLVNTGSRSTDFIAVAGTLPNSGGTTATICATYFPVFDGGAILDALLQQGGVAFRERPLSDGSVEIRATRLNPGSGHVSLTFFAGMPLKGGLSAIISDSNAAP